ncbi:MAG: hypothetical protein IJP92_00735 [Lachnospiraceae bacterium]|nr:hypothetical protein [Lachnospiraceae bacterium]
MTIFEYLNPPTFDYESELERDLKRGSQFENGKKRIRAMYDLAVSPVERQKMLAKEYGIGGHSADYTDGSSGFVDYSGKGITISRWGEEEKKTFSWSVVERILREMVENGRYGL